MAKERVFREWYDEEILRRDQWQRDQLDRKISEIHRRYKDQHAFATTVPGEPNKFRVVFAEDYSKPEAIIQIMLIGMAREPQAFTVFEKE